MLKFKFRWAADGGHFGTIADIYGVTEATVHSIVHRLHRTAAIADTAGLLQSLQNAVCGRCVNSHHIASLIGIRRHARRDTHRHPSAGRERAILRQSPRRAFDQRTSSRRPSTTDHPFDTNMALEASSNSFEQRPVI